MIAYEFYTKAFSRWDVQTNESRPERTLAGHFLGAPLKSEDGFGGPAKSYGFPNKKAWWETIPPLLERASPLRTSHLRDPVGPQIQFASESFWDEVAHALGVDPVEFRLKYVKDPRDAAVLRAAADKHGWKPRPSPDKSQTGNTVTGRGIAYAWRNGTTVAVVAEVDVDRRTGKIWARKFTVAHDCGQIINPDGLKLTIDGNIIQGISRTIWEEVQFNNKAVTSDRLAELSDPRHYRGAGGDRLRADQPAGARSDRRGRAVDPPGRRAPSPMRCSTPPACASAARRSRRTGCGRQWRKPNDNYKNQAGSHGPAFFLERSNCRRGAFMVPWPRK